MKAEELFVGALVRVNRDGLCIKKDTIVEVRGVDADDRLAVKGLVGSAHCRPLDDDQFEGGIWCEYLEPIPLTPEILEKNGFTRDGESWWYKDFRIVLFSSNGVSLICGRQMRFKYVHELQNALRLCIIEKEIEL